MLTLTKKVNKDIYINIYTIDELTTTHLADFKFHHISESSGLQQQNTKNLIAKIQSQSYN